MEFNSFKEQHLSDFEHYMYGTVQNQSGTVIEEAMNYSLTAGGKRLRPLLLLAALEFFNVDIKKGYSAAAALEMIHTYSLIHDDLPALDNDDLRRGLPTNHKKFGEASAILAGDALLTKAFEVIVDSDVEAEKLVKLSSTLAQAAGHVGMIGGQQADINGENSDLTLEELKSIHERKTGELLRFALVAGGIISGQSEEINDRLAKIALDLGIAYQIRDDILDVIGDEAELGKAVGADEKLGKSTYPSLLGLEEAKETLESSLNEVKQDINEIAKDLDLESSEVLTSFVDSLYLGA